MSRKKIQRIHHNRLIFKQHDQKEKSQEKDHQKIPGLIHAPFKGGRNHKCRDNQRYGDNDEKRTPESWV